MDSKKIEELKEAEAQRQALLMQKQTTELELSEVNNALTEVKKSREIYKIIGGIMLGVEKNKVEKELKEKEKILEMKIGAIEKQEKLIEKDIESLRKNVFPSEKNAKQTQ